MTRLINISEAVSIAFHALVIVAKSDKRINVIGLANEMGSSKHHIAKVMQRLHKENLVSSSRGPKGGFVLNKKPEELNLLYIYEMINGKIENTSCPMHYPECKYEICVFSNLTKEISSEFVKYLKNHSIGDFMN